MDSRRDISRCRSRPVLVSRASMAWDNLSPRPPGPPAAPGSSVRAHVVAERARRRRGTGGRNAAAVVTAVGALGVLGLAVTGGGLATLAVALCVAVLPGVAVRRRADGAVVRQLRHQVRDEVRVARTLAPLQSAGWTLLHDRVVAAHRVPRIVVGLPGVVLVYDHAVVGPLKFPAGRALALFRGLLRLALAAPLTMLPARRRRHHPAVGAGPGRDVLDTAAWASDGLADRLRRRPDLDRWTVAVSPLFVVLRRPGSRPLDRPAGVALTDIGSSTRVHLQCGRAAGLSRESAHFLASVVDEVCPPA
jgi:hypothetical protein